MLVISDKELMSSAVLEEWDEYLEEKEKKGGRWKLKRRR
jgi:hypothetical protein